MYKKVSTDMNFVDREKETEKFWEDNHIFEKSMEDREGCPQYMFYDGPPTACYQGYDSSLPYYEGV